MSEYKMRHTGEELDEAIEKVKNGYLNPADLITHTMQSASGSFKGSGQTLANISINTIGFKPKIFYIQNQDAVYNNSTSTPYSLVSSLMLYTDESTTLLRRTSFVLKGDSSNGYGRGGQSSLTNGFTPTDNGVQGTGTNVKANNGVTYNWWAWG